jgi:AraC family transcriptional activator of pobA
MLKTRTDRGIPHFGLYGESSVDREPGFVHIEDIAARSREVGWRIKPHRHGNLFQVLCVFEGQLEVQLDDQNHSLEGGWAITIPPGVVHGFRFQPDIIGTVLTLAAPLFGGPDQRKKRRYFDALTQLARAIGFNSESVLFDQLKSYLNLIEGEFQQAEMGYQKMLEWQVKMVLMTLKRQLENQRFQALVNKPNSDAIKKFRLLLENNYRDQWNVQQYASAMHTSISTLNRRCNECLGISAKAIIQNRVMVEAKRKLIYTRYPLDRIAYALGFKDPAYFSRFFKKLAGLSPIEYRRGKEKLST